MTLSKKTSTLALFAAFGVFTFFGCQTPDQPLSSTTSDYAAELEPIMDRYLEVWNTKDYDKLDGLLAPNFRRVAPDQNADGPEEMHEFIRQVHTAYPDFQIVKGESLFGDDLSFIQWTVTGTSTSEDGTETGVEVRGMTMVRYANGMITDEIVQFDTADLLRQLDASELPHAE